MKLDGNIIYSDGDRPLAAVYKEVDGYFVVYSLGNGTYTSQNLRDFADLLDNLNAEWDAEVQAEFNINTHGA